MYFLYITGSGDISIIVSDIGHIMHVIFINNVQVMNVTAGSTSSGLPDSTLIGIAASVGAALIIYTARQVWERRKLRKALLAEVEQMKGIKKCADRMREISTDPSSRALQPDDVPAPDSIPTVIYENNAGQVGLLGSFFDTEELEKVVKFYSKVLRYRSIIRDVRDGEASGADQEDLYDDIREVSNERNQIMDSSSFTN
jgi:hypothetical protein